MNIRACTVLTLSCGLCSIPTTDCYGSGRDEASECFLESMLGTERKSLGIENEIINWDEIKLHMLKTLLLYKRMDYIYMDKSILVDSNRAYCEFMSLGFKIENIEVARNSAKAVLHQMEHQLLTDVIRMGNMSLVTSTHHRVFLNDQKLSSLLKNMDIVTKLDGKELLHNLNNLSLKDRYLTYVDKESAVICQTNLFMKQHHIKMNRFKKEWENLWMEIVNLEDIIYGDQGQDHLGNLLYKCLKMENPKEWDRIKAATLDTCIKTQEKMNQEQKRLYKRSSLWSYILGEGASIDRNQDDINQITDTFNSNFHLIHTEEENLRGKLNQIIRSGNTLSKHETILFHNLQMIEIDNHQKSRRNNFEIKRTQQIEFLLELLQTSMVRKKIRKLKMGLQIEKGYNMGCQGNRCISQIRVSHKDKDLEVKTTWSKDFVKNKVRVTCTPIEIKNMNSTDTSNRTWFISTLHKTIQDNCFQQQILNPTLTILQQQYKICNSSFWHSNLKMISPQDFDIPYGIIAKTNNKLRLLCTVDMTVMINDIRRTCKPDSHILITNTTDFKIQTEDGKYIIEAHTLTQTWEQTNNVFNSETEVDNDNDITKIPAEDIGVGYMGNIFVLADGKPHKRNIAISGVTITVTALTILGGVCCWCRNSSCVRRMCSGCPPRGNDTQERKDRMVNNILNQIREGMDANIEDTSGQLSKPPPPPNLEI